jgi:hypothetical protein
MANKDILESLLIPTNPEYDWEADANSQPEYVNPVTLNNREVLMANAAIVITQQHIKVNRQLAQVSHRLQEAEHAVSDFERDLLLRFPAPSTATKNNKLLQVYIYSVATTQGYKDQYETLVRAVRTLSRDLAKWEAEAENCKAAYQAVKLGGEHIQTHLSFVKNEQKVSGRF